MNKDIKEDGSGENRSPLVVLGRALGLVKEGLPEESGGTTVIEEATVSLGVTGDQPIHDPAYVEEVLAQVLGDPQSGLSRFIRTLKKLKLNMPQGSLPSWIEIALTACADVTQSDILNELRLAQTTSYAQQEQLFQSTVVQEYERTIIEGSSETQRLALEIGATETQLRELQEKLGRLQTAKSKSELDVTSKQNELAERRDRFSRALHEVKKYIASIITQLSSMKT